MSYTAVCELYVSVPSASAFQPASQMCVESVSLNSVWLVSCVARPIVLKVLIDAVVDPEEYPTSVCMWLVLAFAMVVLAESILQVCVLFSVPNSWQSCYVASFITRPCCPRIHPRIYSVQYFLQFLAFEHGLVLLKDNQYTPRV